MDQCLRLIRFVFHYYLKTIIKTLEIPPSIRKSCLFKRSIKTIRSIKSCFIILYIIPHYLAGNGIVRNPRVAQAMKSVDRSHFCSQNPYMDSPQGIGYAVTISAPHMVSAPQRSGKLIKKSWETIYCKRRNFRAVHVFAYFAHSVRYHKYDVSENLNHFRLNGIRYEMCKNMSTRKCHRV